MLWILRQVKQVELKFKHRHNVKHIAKKEFSEQENSKNQCFFSCRWSIVMIQVSTVLTIRILHWATKSNNYYGLKGSIKSLWHHYPNHQILGTQHWRLYEKKLDFQLPKGKSWSPVAPVCFFDALTFVCWSLKNFWVNKGKKWITGMILSWMVPCLALWINLVVDSWCETVFICIPQAIT